MIAMGCLMFVEFTGAILICIYGVEESPVLIEQLNEKFLALIYKLDIDPEASRILRQIMEYVSLVPANPVQVHNCDNDLLLCFCQVGCCGADGSEDFINALKPVPMECRDRVTGVEYVYGCQQQFAW